MSVLIDRERDEKSKTEREVSTLALFVTRHQDRASKHVVPDQGKRAEQREEGD
jgi:hypothetical protein